MGIPCRFGANLTVRAKSLVATASYVPVPIVMMALFALGGPTSWVLLAIPSLEFLVIPAAATTEFIFFIQNCKKRGGSAGQRTSATLAPRKSGFLSAGGLVRLGGALLAAGSLIAAPLAAYGVTYLVTASHTESIVALTVFVSVQALTNRS